MPFTRCSRASSSTSRLAVRLVTRGRGVLGGSGAALRRGRAVLGGSGAALGRGGAVLGRGGAVLGRGGGVLGRRARGGGLGVRGRAVPGRGIGGLGGPAARPLAVRLGGLAGRRLGVLRLRGVRGGGRLAGPALVWLGVGRLQVLGHRRGKGFLLVRLGLSGLQRSLGPGQALELLPVTGDLEDPPDRVGGLRSY